MQSGISAVHKCVYEKHHVQFITRTITSVVLTKDVNIAHHCSCPDSNSPKLHVPLKWMENILKHQKCKINNRIIHTSEKENRKLVDFGYNLHLEFFIN